ncbi:MAG: hypothetical protein IV086_08055 [Hyphomonadaceae bacterium]|nr:hypothetical protein [Hyphomonadaceae bacterium]
MTTRACVAGFCIALVAGCSASQPADLPTAISIPGDRLFTESLTSSRDGTFYVGSYGIDGYGARTIYRALPGSAVAEVWISPTTESSPGYLGVLADDASNTLWACVLPERMVGRPTTAPSVLRAFDLKTGAIKASYPLPTPEAICNDIAIAADGAVYATDTENMEIVRLRKGAFALEAWSGNGAFGGKGGILDGIAILGDRVFVNALATNKLFAVSIERDGAAGPVSEIELDRPILAPDGMRSFGKDLLLVESGGPGRLSRVTLSGNFGKVATVSEGYPGGAVAVTVVGTNAYVLEAQFAAEETLPKTPTKPYEAVAVHVGAP